MAVRRIGCQQELSQQKAMPNRLLLRLLKQRLLPDGWLVQARTLSETDSEQQLAWLRIARLS